MWISRTLAVILRIQKWKQKQPKKTFILIPIAFRYCHYVCFLPPNETKQIHYCYGWARQQSKQKYVRFRMMLPLKCCKNAVFVCKIVPFCYFQKLPLVSRLARVSHIKLRPAAWKWISLVFSPLLCFRLKTKRSP